MKNIFIGIALLYSCSLLAQDIVQKDKTGKPLPVCAQGQVSTKEKPCRKITTSQRVGTGIRS